jgi:hypothetical protein
MIGVVLWDMFQGKEGMAEAGLESKYWAHTAMLVQLYVHSPY